MQFIWSFLLIGLSVAAIPGYTQAGGQTRLLGSSFGVPGVNATYDYIVGAPGCEWCIRAESAGRWWWDCRPHRGDRVREKLILCRGH